MKKNLLLALTMSVCLSLHAQPVLKREFRGVWLATVANIDWPSSSRSTPEKQRADMIGLLDTYAAAGFNAVGNNQA